MIKAAEGGVHHENEANKEVQKSVLR